ncbi:uncharacterized protein LOC111365920 isoform X2 [Olea europaea var. sylvestris]|uniref:uncharacterized protein LOC111365920 isoform X2 n=1 Tax=Olea europaea var. sylvestris TaxID=158386 RepID=UPI000C1D17D7|nr:uncharacterized protein LOC111365920 isoform X2 [Olea europaea var. sylvestris]
MVTLGQNILSEKHSCLKTILGQFDHELLKEADVIVVSPGVTLENYEVLPRYTKVLAVTGTNGKSTVATFAGQILHQLNIETFVGRNLGIPLSEATFQCLTSCPKRFLQARKNVAIVEVSSYHLEIPYKFFCPSVAVILNLTPDHLERPKTMENYAMTKCRVFSHMTDKRIAILPLGM